MKIKKIQKSLLKTKNLNQPFGSYYTDHMFKMVYENGKWHEPEIIPYQTLKIEPGCNTLHYGQSIFEGMKAFKSKNNEILLFRPQENFKRLNVSAARMAMPQFDEKIVLKGLKKLLELDQKWIPSAESNSFLYIRPFMFGNEVGLIPKPQNKYLFLIIMTPLFNLYNNLLDVLIQDKYSRAASGGVGYTKTSGNYAAALLPSQIAKEQGFQEVVWTDCKTHKFIEECGTMNVFVRIDNTIYTPKLTDAILPGITRSCLIEIIKKMKIKLVEKNLPIKLLINAYDAKKKVEFFGCGTAAVIVPFKSFGYKNKKYNLEYDNKSYAMVLKQKLTNIQYGIDVDEFNWVVKIKK